MNYKNFEAICTFVHMVEEDVPVTFGLRGTTIEQLNAAKESVLWAFSEMFPETIEEIQKSQSFESPVFFGLMVKYPELLIDNEERFLNLVIGVATHESKNHLPNVAITADVFHILNSFEFRKWIYDHVSDEFMKCICGSVSDEKENTLCQVVEALLPFWRQNPEEEGCLVFYMENLPEWAQFYPKLFEHIEH